MLGLFQNGKSDEESQADATMASEAVTDNISTAVRPFVQMELTRAEVMVVEAHRRDLLEAQRRRELLDAQQRRTRNGEEGSDRVQTTQPQRRGQVCGGILTVLWSIFPIVAIASTITAGVVFGDNAFGIALGVNLGCLILLITAMVCFLESLKPRETSNATVEEGDAIELSLGGRQ